MKGKLNCVPRGRASVSGQLGIFTLAHTGVVASAILSFDLLQLNESLILAELRIDMLLVWVIRGDPNRVHLTAGQSKTQLRLLEVATRSIQSQVRLLQ
jgi:hypothetical protein